MRHLTKNEELASLITIDVGLGTCLAIILGHVGWLALPILCSTSLLITVQICINYCLVRMGYREDEMTDGAADE